MNRLKLLQIIVLWCIIGRAATLLNSWFARDAFTIWDETYFIWNEGKDALFLYFVYLTIDKQYRWLIAPIFFYFTIAFIWQIAAFLTDLDVNYPAAVLTVFSALLTGVIILLIKDLIQLLKRK